MSKVKKLHTYEVTYIVMRPVTFRVEAASPAEAEQIGIAMGESIAIAPVIDFRHVSTKLVAEGGNEQGALEANVDCMKNDVSNLLEELQQFVERSRAEAAARDLTEVEITWLEAARQALAKVV